MSYFIRFGRRIKQFWCVHNYAVTPDGRVMHHECLKCGKRFDKVI